MKTLMVLLLLFTFVFVAATVGNCQAIVRGQVTQNGRGVPNVSLSLRYWDCVEGGSWVVGTRTNQFGYYYSARVPGCGTFSVTPKYRNYVFDPAFVVYGLPLQLGQHTHPVTINFAVLGGAE